jgi:hypothetical protein
VTDIQVPFPRWSIGGKGLEVSLSLQRRREQLQ